METFLLWWLAIGAVLDIIAFYFVYQYGEQIIGTEDYIAFKRASVIAKIWIFIVYLPIMPVIWTAAIILAITKN